MHFVFKVVPATMVAALLLTGCSQPPHGEFKTTVTLKHVSADCDNDPRCWLPTQFQPQLVSKQSVSRFNDWPAKGDTVTVICQTKGQTLRDNNGRTSTKWFGILVPKSKVATKNTKAHSVKGGYLGYVSALWLAHKQTIAPTC